MPKNKPQSRPYWEMNTEELRQATREFDAERDGLPGHPLSAADRKRWERLRRKPGRPTVGKGHRVISVSIEQGLLDSVDALATQRKISRASLIAQGLRSVLAGA
ncbi:MAG: hypothetical protein ACHRHE_08460 [Tepidisphaerales bacterium]